MSEAADTNSLELATELTIAWLANPNTRASAEEVPAFLEKMRGAVVALASPVSAPASESCNRLRVQARGQRAQVDRVRESPDLAH